MSISFLLTSLIVIISPGTGVLYSPFGPWGFYSPAWAYNYGPYLGFGYYGGYYGRPWYGYPRYGARPGVVGHPVVPRPAVGAHYFHPAGPRVGSFSGPRFGGMPAVAGGFHGGFGGGGFRL